MNTNSSNAAKAERRKANRYYREIYLPLLTTKGKFSARKIKNEITDLLFVFQQVAAVYDYITGGLLSKEFYYADTIIQQHNEQLNESYDEGFKEGLKEGSIDGDSSMQLYSFRPSGHGQMSFFVMAKSLEQAREFVQKRIDKDYPNRNNSEPYEVKGWKDGDYGFCNYKEGEVTEHNND